MPPPPRPASPPARFLLGHQSFFEKEKLGFLSRTARDYGDFVPLRFGPRRVFLLSDPAGIGEVLVTRAASFRKDLGLRRTKILLGEGLLTSEGERHDRSHRIAQPALRPRAVEAHGATMAAASSS